MLQIFEVRMGIRTSSPWPFSRLEHTQHVRARDRPKIAFERVLWMLSSPRPVPNPRGLGEAPRRTRSDSSIGNSPRQHLSSSPRESPNLAPNPCTDKDFNKTSCRAKVSGNPGNYMQTCVGFARLARGTAGRLTREVIFPNRFPKILR